MVSQIVGLICGGLLAVDASVLDLTPLPHLSPLEGHTFADYAFKYGDSLITFEPPGDWKLTGSSTRAILRPEEPQAEASIAAFPKPAATTFDNDTVKAMKAELVASLPTESTNVEWGQDAANGIRLNGHDTLQVVLSYSSYGQRFTTTVIYCNFERQQMRFELTCRAVDYQKLAVPFRMCLASFRGLP